MVMRRKTICFPEHSFYIKKYIYKKEVIYGNKSNKRIDTLVFSWRHDLNILQLLSVEVEEDE